MIFADYMQSCLAVESKGSGASKTRGVVAEGGGNRKCIPMLDAGAVGQDIYRLKCCKGTSGTRIGTRKRSRPRKMRRGFIESKTRDPTGAAITLNIGLGDAY